MNSGEVNLSLTPREADMIKRLINSNIGRLTPELGGPWIDLKCVIESQTKPKEKPNG